MARTKKKKSQAGTDKGLSELEEKLNNFALNSCAKWNGISGMLLVVFIMALALFWYAVKAPIEWKAGFSVFWIAFFVLAGLLQEKNYKRFIATKKRKEELKRLFAPIKKAI